MQALTDDAPVATVAITSLTAHEQQEFACVNAHRGVQKILCRFQNFVYSPNTNEALVYFEPD